MGIAKRRKKLHCIALVAGLCIALSPLYAFAATQPAANTNGQVEFGVNGDMIDTSQLDAYVAAQDAKAVKYIELDENNNLITSDVPIKHVYMPSKLTDLGYSIQAEYAGTKDFVAKSSRFTLTDTRLQQVPVIPEFVMAPNAEYQPAATTYATASKAQVMTPAAAKAARDAARARPSAPVYTEQPQHRMSAQALIAALALAAAYVLLLVVVRRNKQKHHVLDYKGKLGASNDLVGTGTMFNFSGEKARHVVFPSNLSYLHMMWNIKRFADDKQDGVHTYFYMTFYVPPQEGYARSLQKRKVANDRKAKTHI